MHNGLVVSVVSVRPKHCCNLSRVVQDPTLIGCGFRNAMGFACSLLLLMLLSDRNILQICVFEHNNKMAIVVNAYLSSNVLLLFAVTH